MAVTTKLVFAIHASDSHFRTLMVEHEQCEIKQPLSRLHGEVEQVRKPARLEPAADGD